ncbi:unnamed protein product [Rotaria sp. Silwood2]|nr:unnamed protein product [Rotaria sp. Silwood2]
MSILDEYDKNLTSLAYITSLAEFQTHLHLNDSSKRSTTDKYYELYRSCLKTVAIVARHFQFLINNNHTSLRWLLLRTQAIGEAGENNTVIKLEVQKLRSRMKEIYHRKFIWNNTQLSIDEVQEVLGKLESPNDLLSLWNATYEGAIPMRDYYSTLIATQNQQAKQNRLTDKTDSTTNNEERRIVEQLWQELKPLHRLLHAYIRQQMSKLYPELIQLDQPIPVHLTKDIFGSMMTYLVKDILPFPHLKGIDFGPAMKQKNFTEEKIFHYADRFFVSLNLTQVPNNFWNLSIFKKIPGRHMACHPTAFDMYKYDDVRFHRSPHGAFSEAIGDAIALTKMSPTHLKRIGLLENYSGCDKTILLELGSSKPWEDILEEFAGVRTFSAKSCLRYFKPLQDYLAELVEQGQLKVGWTCNNKSTSIREELFRRNFLLFIFMNFILSFSFFYL